MKWTLYLIVDKILICIIHEKHKNYKIVTHSPKIHNALEERKGHEIILFIFALFVFIFILFNIILTRLQY